MPLLRARQHRFGGFPVNMSAVLALKVLVMFLLVGIGYALFRAGKITM